MKDRNMKYTAFFAVLLSFSATHAQTSTIPNVGHITDMERWIISNKINDDLAKALRICEAHVDHTTGGNIVDHSVSFPFEVGWEASCNAIREKSKAAEASFKTSKAADDKAIVDSLAK